MRKCHAYAQHKHAASATREHGTQITRNNSRLLNGNWLFSFSKSLVLLLWLLPLFGYR